MMKKSFIIVVAPAAVAVFGLFIALAQAQVIFVPYFTPARIEFQGLEDQYFANGSMSYTISLKGYGSNCVALEAGIFRQDDSLLEGEERVTYFSQKQDCRIIDISQGSYNYTKSFSYSGNTVLGKPGDYQVKVTVVDQISKEKHTEKRSFVVSEDSS
jgi:hypothetical protein